MIIHESSRWTVRVGNEIYNPKLKGAINFQIKDGCRPNLPKIPPNLCKVYYSAHALEVMRLPSRGHGEVLAKFPIRCKSMTGLHPCDLKRNWKNTPFLKDALKKYDSYKATDWEWDYFPLNKMPIISYKTTNNESDGEIESILFAGEWGRKYFRIPVRINLCEVCMECCQDSVEEKYYLEAPTIYPMSWKEYVTATEVWEKF